MQNDLDHEIAQQTKLRSAPHERLKRVLSRREEFPVSPVKMLAGREGNYSGRGRFSSADRCHILNKYLPVKGPSVVDQLTTRAYVSQFSNDGSLFVAAFQGSRIKVYNADMGWKLQKNIVAKSLRWTVTDTSLSPDKRFLVYATMSPVVNIVNIGSAATESYANVTCGNVEPRPSNVENPWKLMWQCGGVWNNHTPCDTDIEPDPDPESDPIVARPDNDPCLDLG
ncbi:hypothetical protein L1987_50459 [Smallanthus sonchifolius]|uniref:Uncharacterized protein n=1 Tax=Smallanthus sonchifolius TaxID=185202 RepID=A0ACB9EME0_9ASTR|nr:hypothetical protein L1987_50459 [Smallanthus sonchifolius]